MDGNAGIRKVFLGEMLFLLVVIPALGFAGVKTGYWANAKKALINGWQEAERMLSVMNASEENKLTGNSGININITTSGTVDTTNTIRAETSIKPTATRVKAVPVKECFRYNVIHLDGSSSNLCYSKTDYNVLVDLGYKLVSAKTFYEFHLDSANDYQDEYNRTKSRIYLDAKASSEASAAREKEKINSVTLQMQGIEKRGY